MFLINFLLVLSNFCRFSVAVNHLVTCFMQFYWAETVIFIELWQLIILYIDWIDWSAGHLTTTEGTGSGAFANNNCPQGREFEKNSNVRDMPGGLPGGMLAVGIDSHINFLCDTLEGWYFYLKSQYISDLPLGTDSIFMADLGYQPKLSYKLQSHKFTKLQNYKS